MDVTQSLNLMIRKLEGFHPLSSADKDLLQHHSRTIREIPARQDIASEGDRPDFVYVMVSGFACRYKLLADGRRQIMAYMVPGDFCDFQVFILKERDHGIATLSNCKVVQIPAESVLELTERPAIARAFWWATLVDEATLREWLVSIGQREAEVRIAHLLCEMLMRLRAVGLVEGNSYSLPLTQADLADTMGMTVVHANRMLMSLREKDLIAIDGRQVTVIDVRRLEEFAGFNPNYLHLQAGSTPKPAARQAGDDKNPTLQPM
ncbi:MULTISPECIES: Crp/Fnr family transcriptional regulator [unclassified Aureimonas]|uniref:Crp/Fnr family transcriptional regulator n=1 Tax=unclassified Aureimonas TaxID=2615206 RepID=UPI0006F483E9|nr:MULTISPECIES: Crp/Fnr family transcriptional regulator [unclassified Aureimonas]KQT52476.1 cyclic nucleotide-binding protein [Aureimonas sp. Leaf427]KQT77623.1 cyclic nucleotide-binding protein [Aureimonas sp. Leaf460]